MSRTAYIFNGSVRVDGVPDDVTDAQVEAAYRAKFPTAQMTATNKAAAAAGYDAEAARSINIPEDQISDYVKQHPRYDLEQATAARAKGQSGFTNFLEGAAVGAKQTAVGTKQIVTETPAVGPETRAEARNQVRDLNAQEYGLLKTIGGRLGWSAEKVAEALTPAFLTKIGGTARLSSLLQQMATKGVPAASAPGALERAGGFVSGMTADMPAFERYGGSMVQGGVYGGMQPVTGDQTKPQAIIEGMGTGVAAQGVADVAGRAAGFMRDNPPSGLNLLLPNQGPLQAATLRAKLQDLADKRGYELPLAAQLDPQKFGGQAAAKFQSAVESLPFGGWNTARMNRKNFAALQRDANTSMGKGGAVVDDQTLGNAQFDIGHQLQRIAGAGNANLRADFSNSVQAGKDKYSQLQEPDPAAMRTFDAWLNLSGIKGGKPIYKNGQVVGTSVPISILMANRSALAKDAAAAARADNWQLADAKASIVNAIDDAVEAALPQKMQGMYAEARQQWRNFLIVSKAYDKNIGGVNGNKLYTALSSSYGEKLPTIPTGDDRLVDAARIHGMFQLKVPDSGTTGRLTRGQMIMNTVGLGGGAGVGAGVGTATGVGAIPGAAAGVAALPAIGGVATSSTLGRLMTVPLSPEAIARLQTGLRATAVGLGLPSVLRLNFGDLNGN